ncbi:MAG: hypothetical protein KIS94_08625 [Chitinophagales bacterium]|nr:hypothetical protein [Chitinophagales bacterium]
MLLGNFYTIIETSSGDNGYRARVQLNAAHPIFEGHFPANPVVPGVCQIQMVEEMLTQLSGKKMQLKTTGYVKFLHTVNPATNNVVEMDIVVSGNGNETTEVNATYVWNDKMVFKFKGYFE